MKLSSALSLAFFSLFFIAGCNKISEQTFDVSYYKEHAEERKKKIEECKNDPGKLRMTPNCINAAQAQDIVDASREGAYQVKPATF